MEDHRPRRLSVKTRFPNWKEKLRENCLKRVQEDRNNLLWKMRLSKESLQNQKVSVESAFQDIVSDELKRLKNSSLNDNVKILTSDEATDLLWEYDDAHIASQSEREEILLEMERIFYQDLESARKGDCTITWEDEVDDYLARAVLEHMQLNGDQVCKKEIWCPICKRGKLQENHHFVYCTLCELKLSRGNEVSLDFLKDRLGEASIEHLDRGCRLTPKFCVETRFNLTALYIKCEACNTFEIVV